MRTQDRCTSAGGGKHAHASRALLFEEHALLKVARAVARRCRAAQLAAVGDDDEDDEDDDDFGDDEDTDAYGDDEDDEDDDDDS
jgi:hypothetical protein